MAKYLCCVLLIVSIAWAVMAADEDGCDVPGIEGVVQVGAVVTPIGNCLRIKCERKGVVSALTCSEEQSINPKCKKIFPDPKLFSYPKCCPYFKCD